MVATMKIIALMPVRNEAWVLPHSLACLSAFCDVDPRQRSGFRGRIARDLPAFSQGRPARIVPAAGLRTGALAAARCGARLRGLQPAVVHRCRRADVADAWRRDSSTRSAAPSSREPWSSACTTTCGAAPIGIAAKAGTTRPYWKQIALRRRSPDGLRAARAACRCTNSACRSKARAAGCGPTSLPVLHLQWLLAERNQMRQAWYRCREWLDGAKAAAAINAFYSVTLPDAARTHRAMSRRRGSRASPFPDLSIDREPSWQERDILRLVRRALAGVLRAARDLAHPGAARRVPPPASDGRRGPIARTCRPGRSARSVSAGGVVERGAPAAARLTWRAPSSRS